MKLVYESERRHWKDFVFNRNKAKVMYFQKSTNSQRFSWRILLSSGTLHIRPMSWYSTTLVGEFPIQSYQPSCPTNQVGYQTCHRPQTHRGSFFWNPIAVWESGATFRYIIPLKGLYITFRTYLCVNALYKIWHRTMSRKLHKTDVK